MAAKDVKFNTDARDRMLKGVNTVDDLRMGMTVALSAERDGSGWQTTQLRRIPVLIGPITGAGEVMGVAVEGELPAEGSVIIDGYWTDDGVIATRVSPAGASKSQITGRFDPTGAIGAVPVTGVADRLSAIQLSPSSSCY